MAKVATFEDATSVAIGDKGRDDENNDSGEELCEISEWELYETSDEKDTKFLQLTLESAYACLPLKSAREPAKLSSYLLLDKDLLLEDNIDDLFTTIRGS